MSHNFKDPFPYLVDVLRKSQEAAKEAAKAPSEVEQLRAEFDRKLAERDRAFLDALKGPDFPGAA